MSTQDRIFELFRDGHKLESIKSGWHLNDAQVAEAIIAGHRAGENVDPAWLLPPSVRDRLLEVLDERRELGPTAISSLFQGKVSPDIVKALRIVRAGRLRIETRLFNEETYSERFRDDIAGAESEILIVAHDVKGEHWRQFAKEFRRLAKGTGTVAFFAEKVSDMLTDEIKRSDIILIEKRTRANLVLIDGEILWEGSMNFLLPPRGDEHIRRTLSRLQCDEVKDLNDLFV